MNQQPISRRPTLDVFDLPESMLDHRSSIWWGNLLLIVIETTMFALIVGGYFYARGGAQAWPPPQTNWAVARYDTNPSLFFSSINLAVIVLSCAPMLFADRMALRLNARAVAAGLIGCMVLGIAAIWLRFHEFFSLNFRWDDNAYGSIVWTILGLHLLHLIVGSLENSIMLAWALLKGLDKKHARDVRVNAVYWYWIAGTWVILWAVVYLGPRVL